MKNEGILNIEKALGRLRKIKLKKAEIENVMKADINTAKARAENKVSPLNTEEKEIVAAMAGHCKTNRRSIFPGKEKCADYVNGRVGFRLSKETLVISKAKGLRDRLKKFFNRNFSHYLHITYTPDKEALKMLDDETLKELKIKRRKPRDEFYFDLTDSTVENAGDEEAA